MQFSKQTAEIYVPDGADAAAALARTTHMAVAAHQDDIEIMALEGILACFGLTDKWFLGVVATDGSGSPRDGLYAKYTDAEMRGVRRVEQKKAAFVGEYSAAVFLDHPSSGVKNPADSGPKSDIKALLEAAQPEVVYTHNLADKHDTHVAVALRTIAAIRDLPAQTRPRKLYGAEVWRDLDWLADTDKVVFQLDAHENLAAALLGVFDSQIAGGKRYDLATAGRRRAHATYHQSHGVDTSQMVNFGMDLTPLIEDLSLDVGKFVEDHIQRFAADVRARLGKMI
jgi:LmbE family N-acetylglucosaminyl deacetylase